MTNNTVSYQQVEAVINTILTSGITPTIETVQRSFNKEQQQQVAQYFQQWQKTIKKQSAYRRDMPNEQLINIIETKEQEMAQALALVRATLEATNDGIVVINNEGKIVDYNENFVKLWHMPREVMEKRDEAAARRFVAEQLIDPEQALSETDEAIADSSGEGTGKDLHFKDGRVLLRYTRPHRVNGEIVGRVWSMRDVTASRKAEAALKLRQQAIEATPNGVLIIDVHQPDPTIVYVNHAFEVITGYNSAEVIRKNNDFLFINNMEQPEIKASKLAIKKQVEEQVELCTYRKDGSMFWSSIHVAPVIEQITDIDSDGKLFGKDKNARKVIGEKVDYYVMIVVDITERKMMEEQLLHQATHDTLTDLPNRLLLNDRLRQALLFAKRSEQQAAVLFLDLDRFKLINDSLGHSMGDALLQQVAQRIAKCIRSTDTVSRIGGDEFIIIVSPLENEDTLLRIIEQIMTAVRKPFIIDKNELSITTSLGISLYPKDGYNEEMLLRNADTAMYRAKDEGRNNFSFFTHSMNMRVSRRLTLQNNLHSALQKNELVLIYQPQIDPLHNIITGVEALMRWHNEELGDVSPVEFIPMAEDIGLIVQMGKWVFEQACSQLVSWEKAGIKDIQVAINVSGRQLYNSNIVEKFATILQRHQVNPKNIVLEITENVLLEHTDETIKTLNALKYLGVNIAIDDFGTGYSSLSYLKDIPVDKLKIDKAFITNIDNNTENNVNLTLAIIALAKNLHLTTVAEGVETKAELDFLLKNQCDEIQGYYYSKPLPEKEITDILKQYQHNATKLVKSN